MLSTYDITIALNAVLEGSFMNTFADASKTMGELQKRMSVLGQNQSAISSFGKLQAAANAKGAALNAAQARVRALGEQMRATANPSEQLKRQFNEAHVKAEKLRNKLQGQRKELGQLRRTLTEAGVDTKNFSNEQTRLAESTRLAADATKLQAAQERLQNAQGAVNDSKQRLLNMRSEMLRSAGTVLAFKAPIQQAANFEQAMARVKAVSGATGEDFDTLSKEARRLGRDTQFTATQAANSQEMLARAGFKTNEIMDSMDGLLSMAAAEGMDLASAADIMASTVRGFGLEADQAMRVADLLAKTSATTNTSIATLGESFKNVAPVASGLGIDIEQVAAMIGVMGNAGIKGSLAGNALKTALQRLSKEPKAVKAALKGMGIDLQDAQGRMRTIPSLMKALHKKMKNMGEKDQMQVLTNIFGSEAAAGMLAIMRAATGNKNELKELEEAYRKAGGASGEMAKIMNATAQGAMKRLGSATESLLIDIGNVLLPVFTWGVDALASFVGWVSKVANAFPLVTKVVVGAVAGFGALKVALTALSLVKNAVVLLAQAHELVLARENAEMLLGGKISLWTAAKMKAVSAATKAQTRIVWLWNAALSANPVVLIVLGLIVAFGVLYACCEKFRNAVAGVIEKVKNLFGFGSKKVSVDVDVKPTPSAIDEAELARQLGDISVLNKMSKKFAVRVAEMTAAWQPFKDTLAAGFQGVWDVMTQTGIHIHDIVIPAVNQLAAALSDVVSGAQAVAAAGGIKVSFPSRPAVTSSSSSYPSYFNNYMGAQARGGIFNSPGIALIAEAGSEAVIPLEDRSRGIPLWKAAGEAMGMQFGGNSATTTNNITGGSPNINITINGGGEDVGSFARRVAEEVRRVLREMHEYEGRVSFI